MIAEGATPASQAGKPTESAPAALQPSTGAKPIVESVKPSLASAVTPTVAPTTTPAKANPGVPYYAQLLSTGDQKTAEALAAKLINGGFTSAYVAPGTTDKGAIFRVRVPFASETTARAAEAKLHEYSKDVWITK